jgi:hypothetical protein
VTCYAGDHLVLNVRVSIVTEDGRLEGSFLAPAWLVGSYHSEELTSSVYIRPFSRYESASSVYIDAANSLDSPFNPDSLFEGTFQGQPTDPTAGVEVVVLAQGQAPRVQVRVGVGPRDLFRPVYQALPPDGCGAAESHESETKDTACRSAEIVPGYCCPIPNTWNKPTYPITLGTDRSCPMP